MPRVHVHASLAPAGFIPLWEREGVSRPNWWSIGEDGNTLVSVNANRLAVPIFTLNLHSSLELAQELYTRALNMLSMVTEYVGTGRLLSVVSPEQRSGEYLLRLFVRQDFIDGVAQLGMALAPRHDQFHGMEILGDNPQLHCRRIFPIVLDNEAIFAAHHLCPLPEANRWQDAPVTEPPKEIPAEPVGPRFDLLGDAL